MAAWSGLSGEIKSEVVKRMDLRTRFRFRHVSKSTRSLVDSTPLYIPRIHIMACAEEDIRVFIYERIGSLIHTIHTYYRKQSSFVTYIGKPENLKQRKTKFVTTGSPINSLAATLKTLTSPAQTKLGALELESHLSDRDLLKLNVLLGNLEIRTKIIEVGAEHQCAPILLKCSRSDIEEIHIWEEDFIGRKRRFYFRSLVPGIQCQYLEPKGEDYTQHYVMKYGEREDVVRDAMKDKPLLDLDVYQLDSADREPSKVELFHTPCGFVTRYSNLELVEETNQKCLKRWTCAKCADPFVYWYYYIAPDLLPSHERPDFRYEKVEPMVNGVCPVKKFLDGEKEKWVRHIVKTKDFKDMREKFARL